MEKIKLLYLCTGNSCRSQMAEAWTNFLKGSEIEAYSAGIETHGVNPRAILVMEESGVDMSGQKSQNLSYFLKKKCQFDYIITVCGHADENCPVFPDPTKKLHVGFDDPPKLAENAKSEEEALSHFRRIRDEIKAFVMTLPSALKK